MNISSIEMLTDDLLTTEKFYCHTLGMQVIQKNDQFISFKAGTTELRFLLSDLKNPTYHFAFNIPHNKLTEAITWLTGRVELIKDFDDNLISDFDTWNAKAIYFFDNNRNILEFIARYDLNNESADPFDGTSIQSVSEIGVVTDDVVSLTQQLISKNNMHRFAKQSIQENFVALGDDEGLLILSRTGRNWYPTLNQAKKFYTRIRFKNNGMNHELVFNDHV